MVLVLCRTDQTSGKLQVTIYHVFTSLLPATLLLLVKDNSRCKMDSNKTVDNILQDLTLEEKARFCELNFTISGLRTTC